MLVKLVDEFNPNLLLKFKLSQSWFSKFLHSMGWVDRAVTKASHKLPDGHVEPTETFAMILLFIPGGMTLILQVMDLTVNVVVPLKYICTLPSKNKDSKVRHGRTSPLTWE